MFRFHFSTSVSFPPPQDKVTLVFKGDYNLEKNWPIEAADITDALDLGDACVDCKANAFALAGYLEAVEATNGFENAVAKWKDVGCYFSVTGHGLGVSDRQALERILFIIKVVR